ncbi:MAG: exosortase/archaeosortase family protein [Pseudomonadota bacterium]
MGLLTKLQEKQTSLTILALVALVSCLFSPSIAPLFVRWLKLNQDLSHGLPTLVIFVFLIWRIIPITQIRNSDTTYWFLYAVLALFSFVWYLFQSINVQLISALLLIVVLTIYLAACFSLKTAVDLFPFLGLLLFVVPILSSLTDQLVLLSSFVVGGLVDAVKLTAIIEGNNILIPSGRITIAEGCSGLRYLSITLLLAYIICLMNGYSRRQSMLAILCAIGLGLLTNWVRIFLLVLVGYHSDMQSKLMHDHEMFGWILFTIIIMPAIYWAPIVRKNIEFSVRVSKCKPLIPTLALLLGPLLFWGTMQAELSSNKLNLNGLIVPEIKEKSAAWVPISFPEQTEKSRRSFSIDGVVIRMDLAKYTPLSSSEKLVPYIQNVYPAEDWVPADQSHLIEIRDFELMLLKNINSSQKILLLYQFNVGNSVTDSYRFAKLLQLKAKLLGENFFGLVVIQAGCAIDCREEIAAIKKITQDWQLNKFSDMRSVGSFPADPSPSY